MKYDADELAWVTTMVQIAARDRDAYRRLRAEAWRLVAAAHAKQTAEQRAEWTSNAS